jgi:hypothetical protein
VVDALRHNVGVEDDQTYVVNRVADDLFATFELRGCAQDCAESVEPDPQDLIEVVPLSNVSGRTDENSDLPQTADRSAQRRRHQR